MGLYFAVCLICLMIISLDCLIDVILKNVGRHSKKNLNFNETKAKKMFERFLAETEYLNDRKNEIRKG